ncbi:MAG: glycosyltransferase family 92 protein, partial [bacterium]|nr:glycosyltransferase family 92 protein [bacterium]
FVYFDGTTDGTRETVSDLPFVECAGSVNPERFPPVSHLRTAVKEAGRHHTARQVLNTCDALRRSRAAGLEWLIALDADELICPSTESVYPGQLRHLFGEIPQPVETVRFPCLEVVQRQFDGREVFGQTMFKTPGARIQRTLFDPFRNSTWVHQGFYGHESGKSAVRLSSAATPASVHRFTAIDGAPLVEFRLGWILHYNLYSHENFINKFRNLKDRPDWHLRSGRPISRHRRVWRD